MVTIAPGPAKSGVPSGTIPMLLLLCSLPAFIFPVSNCNEIRSKSSPPAAWSASIEIFIYSRINWPKSAKVAMTNSDTPAACQARRTLSRGDLSPTSPRKIGVAPGGSIITNKVTNAWVAKVTASNEFIFLPLFYYSSGSSQRF